MYIYETYLIDSYSDSGAVVVVIMIIW